MTNYGVQTSNAVITGLFRDLDKANRAYQTLIDLGYDQTSVNVVMTDKTRDQWYRTQTPIEVEHGNKALEGASVGGAIGGTVGAAITLPGIGLVIAGPIAAALAGAGAGGLTGGVIGALVGAGIPEERAKNLEKGITGGGVLISVSPRSESDAQKIERDWKEIGGQFVER
jgi:hypothetical protein